MMESLDFLLPDQTDPVSTAACPCLGRDTLGDISGDVLVKDEPAVEK